MTTKTSTPFMDASLAIRANPATSVLRDANPVACDALEEWRVMDTVLVLTESMALDRALLLLEPDRTPRVGDVLVRSWGYDQTNIDFYQVTSVTAKSVRIRAIRKRRADAFNDQVEVTTHLAHHATYTTGDWRAFAEATLPSYAQDDSPMIFFVPWIGNFELDQELMTRRFTLVRGGRSTTAGYYVRVEDGYAYLWDGTPQGETAGGFGH